MSFSSPYGPSKEPYKGDRMAMVIAIDVGTTYTGVAYTILRPQEVPVIFEVTRFPDQTSSDRKVPSVLYYDQDGIVQAAGPSTLVAGVQMSAVDEGWVRSEHFKLHLRPNQIPMETNGFKVAPLPLNKSVEDVFGDYLEYIYRCTVEFIKEKVNGPTIWDSCKSTAHFILTHPNAWEGSQLQKMRRSAIQAGMITDSESDRDRITFVSEGEASLHWCLSKVQSDVKTGMSFVIADAGGGTLDVNSYEIQNLKPVRVTEIAVPDCRFAGSIFVNRHAILQVQERLRGSNIYIKDFSHFDSTTKRTFQSDQRPQWIDIGEEETVTIPKLGIRKGRLKLDGKVVAECFELSVNETVASVLEQKRLSGKSKLDVWLVGGFAASPWLYQQLKNRLEPQGLSVFRPDPNTSKAVAEGAILYYLDRIVHTRLAKISCGLRTSTYYDSNDPDHAKRPRRQDLSGDLLVENAFKCLVTMGTEIAATATHKMSLVRDVEMNEAVFDTAIWQYTGPLPVPKWTDLPESFRFFSVLCTVKTDLRNLCTAAAWRRAADGTVYYNLNYDVEITLGPTEFTAQVKWLEGATLRQTPAVVIYEEQE